MMELEHHHPLFHQLLTGSRLETASLRLETQHWHAGRPSGTAQ